MKQSNLQHGFSVIETLIALAVVALVLVPLLSLQGTMLRVISVRSGQLQDTAVLCNALATKYLNAQAGSQVESTKIELADNVVELTANPVKSNTFNSIKQLEHWKVFKSDNSTESVTMYVFNPHQEKES
jgi:prepilin-type N-terminal cleavage/methylation domain-containing protein